jgi:hypothetical protein
MTPAAQRSGGGAAAMATAITILVDALAARLLLFADESRVYLLGRPLNWTCAFKSRLGLPCPTCGMTRSVILTLHGEIGRAWEMAPGGPVAVLGLLVLAAALLVLALFEACDSKASASVKPWIRQGTLIYGAFATVIWLGGWVHSLAAAFAQYR